MSEAPKTSAASGDSASLTTAAPSAAAEGSATPSVPLKPAVCPASGDPAASEALKVHAAADAEPALPHNIRCQVGRWKRRS